MSGCGCTRLLWKIATTRKIRCDVRHSPLDDDDVQLRFCCRCSTLKLAGLFSALYLFFFWFLNAVVCVYFLLLLHIYVHKNWRTCASLTPSSLLLIIPFPFSHSLSSYLFHSLSLTVNAHNSRFTEFLFEFRLRLVFFPSFGAFITSGGGADASVCRPFSHEFFILIFLLSFIFFQFCCFCVCVFDIVPLWESLDRTRNIYSLTLSLAGTLCWIHKKENTM